MADLAGNSERNETSDPPRARLLDELLPDVAELFALLPGVVSDEPQPVPARCAIDTLGRALCDVFSDNHTVVDEHGQACDLGTFRDTGRAIADALNRRYPAFGVTWHYLDLRIGPRPADEPEFAFLFRWIFARLKARGGDWRYSFPRQYVVDFDHIGERNHISASPADELASARRAETMEALRNVVEARHRNAVEHARNAPLPVTVGAYRDVYGQLPDGWPHR